jgi:S1-C subfamily serine protease
VLTNCHVADKFYLGRGEYRPIYAVNYDESIKFKMNVVTCNNETDMALLKSHWPNHDVLPLNITRAAPNFGQIVYSAGYHEFLPLSPKVGYVGQHNFIRGDILMIMQMPLAMGDSGSPVFNKWGSLVGLVTSVYSMGPIPIADISFAVPIWDIRNFLQEHMK